MDNARNRLVHVLHMHTYAVVNDDPDDPDPPRPRGRAPEAQGAAKREGISLSDYLRRELLLLSQQLTWEELFEEMDRENRSFDGVEGIDSAELIRQGREERDRELMGRSLGDDEEP